jgi:hypothetical protein
MPHQLRIIRAPPPLRAGFYKVTYKQNGETHVVHMQLGKYTYRAQLADFAGRNGCRIVSKEHLTDMKKLTWRKA